MTNALTLNGRRVALPPTAPPASPAEALVLAAVRAWQNGQPEFVIRSSGSTGAPKEIGLTRAQLLASATRSVAALGLKAGDATLVALSPATVGGLLGLVRALAFELPLTVIDPTSDVLAAVGGESSFATVSLVPLQLQAVLNHGATGVAWLNRMKAVLVGGAAVSATLAEAVQAVTAPVYHTYGMTETVSHIALRRLNGPARTAYFAALPGIGLRLNAHEALEICADVTGGAWLTTTDRAALLPGNCFHWLGRLDDVINSGGVKVDAARVQRALEAALAARALPHEAVVVGVPDARLGERVEAWLGGPPLPLTEQRALRAALTSALGRYEVPKALRVVAALPRLPGGKVDRQLLRRSS